MKPERYFKLEAKAVFRVRIPDGEFDREGYTNMIYAAMDKACEFMSANYNVMCSYQLDSEYDVEDENGESVL